MNAPVVAPRKTLSLQKRVGLFIVIVLLPLVLLALYFSFAARERELEHIKSQAQAIARATATHQAAALAQVKKQLAALAVAGNSSDCKGLLKSAVDMQSVVSQMAFVDEDGTILCGTEPIEGTVKIHDRPYFMRAVTRKDFVLSQALRSRNNNQWTMVAAQPVLTTSKDVDGVLLASLDLKWAQDGISNLHLPPGSIISMTDSDGTIIARTPAPEQYIGKPLLESTQFKDMVRQQNEGFVESAGLDGIARSIFFMRVPGSELYLRVGIPRTEVDAAGQRAFLIALSALGIMLLLTTLIGWTGARRLVLGPINRLTDAAARLGKGNWVARTGLPHHDDPIGRLALKLDELAQHGQLVNRAFRTLSAGNRTLLRARDETSLLREMCQVAVEKGGYVLAYVCYAQHDEEKSLVPVGHFGEDSGYLDNLKMTWAEGERGVSVGSEAVRTGTHAIVRDIAADERLKPWHEECAKRGFGAAIAMPLRVHGEVIGSFTLLARESGSFSDDEVALLDEMAADLSFGIQIVRERIRHAQAQASLTHTLTHDDLTGLSNRSLFLTNGTQAIAEANAAGEPLAVMLIHLSRLQEVVDGFGYNASLEVIGEVARRFQQIPVLQGSLARVQANEFAVFLRGRDVASASKAGELVLSTFNDPLRIADATIDLSAAIGITCFPGHGDDIEVLLRRAAIAARDGIRRDLSLSVYHGATERENPDRLALAAELRGAIARHDLVLYYQPKIDIQSGKLHSSEALVRWPHPKRGLVSPAQFVPLAEETGLIRPMTGSLVETAIRQQHMWMRQGIAAPVAVNLSVRNLYDPRFLETLQAQLETWGVPASLVEFEITEGALVDDPEAAKRVLTRLRQMGSKTYIDDFGTGYSSLNYLVTLPVHALKIDQSFVKSMSISPEAKSVVASIISMAHNLGLEVVAEGVETEEDLAALAALGCDKAQGYLLSKPIPAGTFAERFLSAAKTAAT